jgi:Lar family restriction alleviation protein
MKNINFVPIVARNMKGLNMIKPCPFCDGSAKVGHEKYYQPRVSRRIICTVCFSSSGWYRTEEEAIEAWNRRSNNASN